MACIKELLRNEENGAISFGDYSLPEKKKVEGFKSGDDILKVKTFKELTKLERDEMFLYESEPGTNVSDFTQDEHELSFNVSGYEDAMITVGLKEDTEYEVFENGVSAGKVKTNLGGKLSISVSLSEGTAVNIRIAL